MCVGFATSCRLGPPKFAGTVEEFVYVSLSFTPVDAGILGYHRHAGVSLDELLDDMSEAALNRRRGFLQAFQEGLKKIDPAKLTAEDRADFQTIQAAIRRQTVELSTRQSYKHDPGVYLNLVVRGIDGAWNQPDEPDGLRAFQVVRRLESVPALMQHAKRNMVDRWSSPDSSAIENKLRDLDSRIPAEIATKYAAARDAALAAVQDFRMHASGLPLAQRPIDQSADIPASVLSELASRTGGADPLSDWKKDAARRREEAYAKIKPQARRILRSHFGEPETSRGWILYAGYVRIEQGDWKAHPSWITAMKHAVEEDPSAVAGWQSWLCLKQAYGQPDFEQKALAEGAIPFAALGELLTEKNFTAACMVHLPMEPSRSR